MKKLLKYMKGYEKECFLGPLFKLLEACFDLTVPMVTAAIIDYGIGNQDKGYIAKYGVMLVLLAMIGLTCSITAQYFAAKAAVGFAARLRHALFSHIETLSFAEMDTIGTSTLITRMTSDINQVQSGVNLALRLFLRSPFIVFGAMIMAFVIDVRAALVFAIVIPLLALVVFGIMGISMPLYKKVQGALDRVLGSTRENLTGVRVIRAFHREQEEEAQFCDENNFLAKSQLFVGRISALTNPVTYVMINLALVALLWVGGIRINAGTLTQGQIVALINYLSQILVELIKLANVIVMSNKALACANRIQGIMEIQSSLASVEYTEDYDTADNTSDASDVENADTASDTPDAGNADTASDTPDAGNADTASDTPDAGNADTTSDSSGAGNARTDITSDASGAESKAGQVIFQNVSMAYQGAQEPSIEKVSFTANPGETIGIIGGTGSGKSTLVHLIPRFYDVTEGTVTVDGQNVQRYPLETLRNKVGIVMQKAVLFKGSIRDNLLWGNENATEQDLQEALELSQSLEFVEKKQDGIDSFVEQGGRNLSGGQKQRLTIARALVRKPEILIFDDSTSALDYATDAKLRSGLKSLSYQPTIFMVSQRTSSIRHADKIIVLEDGKVIGMGTHDELLANCDVYKEIHQSQYQEATERTAAI